MSGSTNFNVEANDGVILVFSDTYNPESLNKELMCNRNLNKTSSTLCWQRNRFKRSCIIKAYLFNFHGMTVTVMKAIFKKLQAEVVNYRNYKNIENHRFKDDLLSENMEESEEGYNTFLIHVKEY